MAKVRISETKSNSWDLGFEAQLWAAADKMRGHMDGSEYKHVCLSLIFLHSDLKADFILANPPFNMSDWGGEDLRQDVRWKFGMPPVNNANYAWIQHFIHHLSPVGVAGFVMANLFQYPQEPSQRILLQYQMNELALGLHSEGEQRLLVETLRVMLGVDGFGHGGLVKGLGLVGMM
jgi:hypothetical protein